MRPPIPSAKYFGFVDPSGGAADSFTLAIAHREPDGKVVLDLVYERRPPFSPNEVARRWRRYCGNIASARFKATITAPASWSASLPNAVSSISAATATRIYPDLIASIDREKSG